MESKCKIGCAKNYEWRIALHGKIVGAQEFADEWFRTSLHEVEQFALECGINVDSFHASAFNVKYGTAST